MIVLNLPHFHPIHQYHVFALFASLCFFVVAAENFSDDGDKINNQGQSTLKKVIDTIVPQQSH